MGSPCIYKNIFATEVQIFFSAAVEISASLLALRLCGEMLSVFTKKDNSGQDISTGRVKMKLEP